MQNPFAPKNLDGILGSLNKTLQDLSDFITSTQNEASRLEAEAMAAISRAEVMRDDVSRAATVRQNIGSLIGK